MRRIQIDADIKKEFIKYNEYEYVFGMFGYDQDTKPPDFSSWIREINSEDDYCEPIKPSDSANQLVAQDLLFQDPINQDVLPLDGLLLSDQYQQVCLLRCEAPS